MLVFRLSTTIYDGTVEFCQRFLVGFSFRRLVEQMTHAARSGKQNIAEGSLEKSVESDIKLTGVARASFGELLEDFKDFLRQRKLPIWEKNDPRIWRIRAFKEEVGQDTNLTNLANWTNLVLTNPEHFANLMVCLIYKENYLLDQLLRSKEKDFREKGGFRENLLRQRREFLQKRNLTN